MNEKNNYTSSPAIFRNDITLSVKRKLHVLLKL